MYLFLGFQWDILTYPRGSSLSSHESWTAFAVLADSSQASAILETADVILSVTDITALPCSIRHSIVRVWWQVNLPEPHPRNGLVPSCTRQHVARGTSNTLEPHLSHSRQRKLRIIVIMFGMLNYDIFLPVLLGVSFFTCSIPFGPNTSSLWS